MSERITDEQINEFVTDLMKSDPVKFIQYCLLVIGRDIHQSNATEFKFSQESELEKGKLFKITVKGTIEEIEEELDEEYS